MRSPQFSRKTSLTFNRSIFGFVVYPQIEIKPPLVDVGYLIRFMSPQI